MKPKRRTPAHSEDTFAELVCSNSLRSDALTNAVGLLKQRCGTIGSLIMSAADANQVPAGSALAVDREKFSQAVTDRIVSDPNITVVEQELDEIPSGPTVIATGPLTSEALMGPIRALLDDHDCYFYDAEAPIVTAESIDMSEGVFQVAL
jgi:methylenetetrahydrofolate--tRNA-(uracil-5-)-methyltransferase